MKPGRKKIKYEDRKVALTLYVKKKYIKDAKEKGQEFIDNTFNNTIERIGDPS